MTIYIALDRITGGPNLPTGLIRGIDETSAGLTAQGFSASTYRGNRRRSIDETDSSVWDNDCIPGWYYNSNTGGVQATQPLTDLERLKAGFRAFHTQINNWADGLDALSRGQTAAKVQSGHDWLYYAKYAGYLIATNQTSASDGGSAVTRTVNVRIGWAGAMAQGALNVASPAQFYADPNEPNPPTTPISWRNLSSPYAAVTLGNAIEIFRASGAPDIDTIDLAMGSWIDTIT